MKVEPRSPVAQVLRPFDVIYEVNGKGVSTAEDVAKALTRQRDTEGLTLSYDRVVKGAIERRTVQVP